MRQTIILGDMKYSEVFNNASLEINNKITLHRAEPKYLFSRVEMLEFYLCYIKRVFVDLAFVMKNVRILYAYS